MFYRLIFNFLVYRFHRNIDWNALKHNQPNFNPSPKTGVILHRSDQGKVGKTPIQNARYGPEEKCIDRH